ncbi:MAG: putative O-methyltransferase YrrM, partial [bacterium]
MWYQIKSYLHFLLKSSNQHGVHSPFVYDLVTTCFYDKKDYSEYQKIKAFRNELLQNSDAIEITDFGAGSRVFKSNTRNISSIAKNTGIPFKRQKLLFRITNYFKSETVLELGTSLGLGTAAIAFANDSIKITTVEGCKNTARVAEAIFKKYYVSSIQLQNATFEDFFNKNTIDSYDLVYIDGNHHKKNTLQYFEYLLDRINDNSVLIFDDIYWSKEMTEAWNQIKEHPKVTVSIDTFYWGIVFFR